MEPVKLELLTPLYYIETDEIPPDFGQNEEFLLAFELDSEESQNIEPVQYNLIKRMLFRAKRCRTPSKTNLPAEKYLFTQKRDESGVLGKEKWLEIAIEMQKDGLWERYRLENRLYIRFLYEDGKYVTQLFRPIV